MFFFSSLDTWSDQQSMQPSSSFYCAPILKFQLFSLQICDYYSCNITEFTKSFEDLEEIREAVGWLRLLNQGFQRGLPKLPLEMVLEGWCKFSDVGWSRDDLLHNPY